jgi:hypothetical protein
MKGRRKRLGPCSLLYQSWNSAVGSEAEGCMVTYRIPGVFAIIALFSLDGLRVTSGRRTSLKEKKKRGTGLKNVYLAR